MQDPRIALVEKQYHKLAEEIPEFRSGDTVKVHVKVTEGNRERIQVFEGVVIGRMHGGLRENFVVRKISYGVDVETTTYGRISNSGKATQISAKTR